jgi:hypothetical protein
MADWLDITDVKSFLGLTPADVYDDEALSNAVIAAEPFVQRARPDAFELIAGSDPPAADFTTQPGPDAYFAAIQLAARLYQRRNSVIGVAAFNELGGPVYVSKFDPDIERGLRIGAYARPMVG